MASLLYLLYINIYSKQDLNSEVNIAGTSPVPISRDKETQISLSLTSPSTSQDPPIWMQVIYRIAKVISGSMASSNDESKHETAHLAAGV
jgi:hypothetical protein